MLDILASCHYIKFQGRTINQTWENDKKPNFWARFWPKFWPQIYFSWELPLLDVRNCFKLSKYAVSKKPNKTILKNGKKNSFWFFWSKFGPKIFFHRYYLYYDFHAISRETNDQNSTKWQNTLFWAWFRMVEPKFGLQNFCFKNLVSSVTGYHSQLSSMIHSWEILVTDGQTDNSDFIRACSNNVERPINFN